MARSGDLANRSPAVRIASAMAVPPRTVDVDGFELGAEGKMVRGERQSQRGRAGKSQEGEPARALQNRPFGHLLPDPAFRVLQPVGINVLSQHGPRHVKCHDDVHPVDLLLLEVDAPSRTDQRNRDHQGGRHNQPRAGPGATG